MRSISTSLVFLEIVFQIDKLSFHASPPCWIRTCVSEPLASLADVVLVDKPLVSLIYFPCVLKLFFWRIRYVVNDVMV